MAEEAPKPGSIVHVEIPCKDPARAKKFYGEVFGWKFEDMPEMNYTTFETGNPPGGGIFTPTEFDPGGVLNYILVDSVEGTSQEIEQAGGNIVVPRTEIPNMGWFAIFKDPDGTLMAIYQGAPPQEE